RTKSGSFVRHALNRPSSNPVRVTRFKYTAGMIWSVSTLLRRSGTAVPMCTVNFSMAVPSEVGGAGQRAADRGRGSHQRRDEVGAAALSLAALEVAVRGRRTALA